MLKLKLGLLYVHSGLLKLHCSLGMNKNKTKITFKCLAFVLLGIIDDQLSIFCSLFATIRYTPTSSATLHAKTFLLF